MSAKTGFYDANSETLFNRYRSVSAENVFKKSLGFFPQKPTRILDVGAGSGRDSLWLAGKGHDLTSVEPSKGMRDKIISMGIPTNMQLVDASLPNLTSPDIKSHSYGFILCSAVWMHLEAHDRIASLARFNELLAHKSDAAVLLSFKLAPPEPESDMYQLDPEQIKTEIRQSNFSIIGDATSEDILGRQTVAWHTLLLAQKKQ